jgi:C4-dicarboxylate transporter DctM subunit
MFLLLLVLFLINVPIALALGMAGLFALVLIGNIPLLVLPQRMFTGTDSFSLLAIPFFLLAGSLMERGGISERIIGFSSTLVGHITGGLGLISVLGSMFFAGISGSAAADTAAMGKITIPEMIKRGYAKSYATAIQATAGAIGIIIPPSIVMILYSVISGASVGQLFVGGIIPGTLIGFALMFTGYLIAKRRNYPTEPRAGIGKMGRSFLESLPALFMPVMILCGILFGVFTATESAVAAVVYGLIVGFFIYKQLKLQDLPHIIYDVALNSAMIMFLVANANVFAWVFTSQQVPLKVAELLSAFTDVPFILLLLIIVVLLIVGTFLDTSAALIILTPVFLPIVKAAGVDLVHFGLIMTIGLAIGMATPPVGLNLFITSGIAKVGLTEASKGLIPFLVAMILTLMLIALIPELVTFLPSLLYK